MNNGLPILRNGKIGIIFIMYRLRAEVNKWFYLERLLMFLLIIIGAFIGRFLHNIPERMKETSCMELGLQLQ